MLGAESVLEVSQRYGLCSEFYFMGLTAGEEDFRYDVTAPAVEAEAAEETASEEKPE